MALTDFLLSLLALVPQGGEPIDSRFTTALTAAEQKNLNAAVRTWFEAWDKYDQETDSDKRIRLNRAVVQAKEKFFKEWTARVKKDPVAHPGDLLAIFDRVFAYPKQSGTGELKLVPSKSGNAFAVVVPKTYKSTDNYPCVLLLPGRKEDRWSEAKEHFESTWKGTPSSEGTLFVAPELDDKLELDPVVDLSTETGDAQEKERIRAVLAPTGEAQRTYRIDRNRLILDCGRGACAFGVRLASYFPQRFAGLILRHPVDPGELRLGSLTGLPVLLLANAETKEAAEKLNAALNELAAGSCRIVEAKGTYPYPEMGQEIAAWAAGTKRDLFRRQVTVEPNHDSFAKAYWVSIAVAESVHGPADQRPLLKVEVDRDANRLTVTARGVTQFTLLLSDVLLDLDKEFSIVINGKALTEKRQRNFYDMADALRRVYYDENYIFPAVYGATVPKEQGTTGAAAPAPAADDKGK